MPGTNQQLPPIITGLQDLQNDPYSRIIIFGLFPLVQTIVVEYSLLPARFPSRSSSQPPPPLSPSASSEQPSASPVRRLCEGEKRCGGDALGHKRSGHKHQQHYTLSVLEELDRFVFEKNDSSNCMDVPYNMIWSPNQPELAAVINRKLTAQ